MIKKAKNAVPWTYIEYNITITWKGYNNSFNSWIDKKEKIQMSEYFKKLKFLGGKEKAELDLLSNKSRFKKCSRC